jgi:hypothetical protein
MRFARRAVLVIMASLLPLLLFASAVDISMVRAFGNPKPVKNVLASSGIYKTVVSSALNQPGQQIITADGSIPLSESIIRNAAAQTFTPRFIQQNTETVIDSVYGWLNGKTPLPDFYINLSDLRTAFAGNVSQEVQKQLSAMPVCTKTNIPTNFDAFSATCLPPQVTASSAAAQVQADILNGQGFLDNPIITADSVKASGDNHSIFVDQAKNAPKVFRGVKDSVYALVALTVLVASSVVALSTNKRKGIRRVGITVLVVGLLILACAWGTNRFVSSNINPNITLSNAAFEDSIRNVVMDLTKSLGDGYWVTGYVYAALGAIMIAGTLLMRPKDRAIKDSDPSKEEPPEEHSELPKEEPDDHLPEAPKKVRKVIVQ